MMKHNVTHNIPCFSSVLLLRNDVSFFPWAENFIIWLFYSPWQQKGLSYILSSLHRSMLPSRSRACSWDTPPGCIHSRTYQLCLWRDALHIKTWWSINGWRENVKKLILGTVSWSVNLFCNCKISYWGPHNSLLASSQLAHSHITCSHRFSSNVKERLFAVLTKSRLHWEEAYRCILSMPLLLQGMALSYFG